MKTLNLKKLQNEFLLLTSFHADRVSEQLDSMEIDQEIKDKIREQVNGFKNDLFQMSNFDE